MFFYFQYTFNVLVSLPPPPKNVSKTEIKTKIALLVYVQVAASRRPYNKYIYDDIAQYASTNGECDYDVVDRMPPHYFRVGNFVRQTNRLHIITVSLFALIVGYPRTSLHTETIYIVLPCLIIMNAL